MDRARVASECVRIERRGGSVRDYLAGLGCISPWGTWHRLQVEELHRKSYEITDGKAKEWKRKYTEEEDIVVGKVIVTPKIREEAVRIALDGQSPLTYLEGLGLIKSTQAWNKIKARLKETDPETWEKLPKRLASRGGVFGRKKPEIPEAVPANIETPEAPVQLNPDYVAALEETVDDLPFDEPEQTHNSVDRITAALTYMNRTVTAIVNPEFGEWHRKGDWIDWETKDGNVISFTIPEWKMLHHMMEDDFRILGVEL